ncbi:hypothetical protein J1N35_005624, partial [Gossypium stocksii]
MGEFSGECINSSKYKGEENYHEDFDCAVCIRGSTFIIFTIGQFSDRSSSMERNLVALSLDDEEEENMHIQKEPDSGMEEDELCLVGCFLTRSVIYFPAMRSTMTNLWHPVKGVQISDLRENRFLFRFYHRMDLERVLKGSTWTFNNHLSMLHHLRDGEDPLKVPLISVNFWVQIHEVPLRFFSKALGRQIGDFLENFLKYDGSNMGKRVRNYLRIRVQLDVRQPLRRKKK